MGRLWSGGRSRVGIAQIGNDGCDNRSGCADELSDAIAVGSRIRDPDVTGAVDRDSVGSAHLAALKTCGGREGGACIVELNDGAVVFIRGPDIAGAVDSD